MTLMRKADWQLDLEARDPRRLGFGWERVRCDSEGAVYLVDHGARSLAKFDPQGREVFRLDLRDIAGSTAQPRDVAVNAHGDIFVADWGEAVHSRVLLLSRDGELRGSFAPEGPVEAIATDVSGFLYLHLPTSRWRIVKYTTEGRFVMGLGQRPPRGTTDPDGGMSGEYLSTIAVDPKNDVYFAPSWIYDIPRFSPDGDQLSPIRRRIREKLAKVVWPDTGRYARSLVIWDIAVSRDHLYVLRAEAPNDRALIDVWWLRGNARRSIELPERSRSIAYSVLGHLFAVSSSQSQRFVRLARYTVDAT